MYETHDKKALLLPNVSSADAGKVLAVDENGKLSLEEMGSGLPEVSESDAGRVLTVSEDGEWVAGSPSGGGSVYYPLISNTHIEASYNDIKADLTAGKTVYIIQDQYMPDMVAYYMLTMEYQGGIAGGYAFDFIGYDPNTSGIMVLSLGSLTTDGDLYKPTNEG